MPSGSDNNKDIDKLKGLDNAVHILKQLLEGKSEEEVSVEYGKNDGQMVKMWMSFLVHNHWIEHVDIKWVLTEKGKKWMAQLESTSDDNPSL